MQKKTIAFIALFICGLFSTVEAATASWYGPGFHGKKTASGQIYDMHAMTAAHNSLPLLSYAKVTNLKNNLSIVVRITDRGSFHGKRKIDLSYAAAKHLGIKGLGSVEITPLVIADISLLESKPYF